MWARPPWPSHIACLYRYIVPYLDHFARKHSHHGSSILGAGPRHCCSTLLVFDYLSVLPVCPCPTCFCVRCPVLRPTQASKHSAFPSVSAALAVRGETDDFSCKRLRNNHRYWVAFAKSTSTMVSYPSLYSPAVRKWYKAFVDFLGSIEP